MKIEIDANPTAEDQQVVWDGLRRYNDSYVPADGDSSLTVFLRNGAGTVCGGLFGKTGRGWLHIITLWVDPSIRGRGYGRQLLVTAEVEALQHGCHSAYLDTFSFQAPVFYQNCGYEIFGTLEAFPDDHKRFFMRKSLVPLK